MSAHNLRSHATSLEAGSDADSATQPPPPLPTLPSPVPIPVSAPLDQTAQMMQMMMLMMREEREIVRQQREEDLRREEVRWAAENARRNEEIRLLREEVRLERALHRGETRQVVEDDRRDSRSPSAGNFKEPKARDPDVFTGKHPEKLNGFIRQCELVFRLSPSLYFTEEQKVGYVIGYLQDGAADSVGPLLLMDPLNPAISSKSGLFKHLKSSFGDPVS